MKSEFAQHILSSIEVAIGEKNFGRMYTIGGEIIDLAANDNQWLPAVIIISGYLVKSSGHVWDAIDLSKRAALIAPEDSPIQKQIIVSLVGCINALPSPSERAEAAQSVAAVAPPQGVLSTISINIMLENVPAIADTKHRSRFLKIIINYAPQGSDEYQRAAVLMKTVANDVKTILEDLNDPSSSILSAFFDKHRDGTGKPAETTSVVKRKS